MLSQILITLQTLLMPLVVVALIVGACAIWLIGRPRTPAPPSPASEPGPAPDTESPPATVIAGPPPLAAPLPAPPAAAAPAVPLAADLLLVDDSAVVRAKLRRLFEAAGYRVALARDGLEALQLLEQGRYALMLTDLEMPRLDGVGLIHAVQAQAVTAEMPIMAITGHDDLQARLNECQAICGIHRKPWIDEDLLGHVQELVGSRSTPGAAIEAA